MKKENKIKLSNVILITIFEIIILLIVAIAISAIFKNVINNDKEIINNLGDSKQNVENKQYNEENINTILNQEDDDETANKSYKYVYDLNGDGNKENIKIEFEGEQLDDNYIPYNRLKITVIDGKTSIEYELKKQDNTFIYVFNPEAQIIDIDETDNFKEIHIYGTLGDASPQYKINLLAEYTGNKLEEIKVNKYNGNIKTFDYETEPDSNYIMEGVYTSRIFYGSEGYVSLNSNSNKRILYKLNENHELILEKYTFDEEEEYYTDFLKTWQVELKVYEKQDINSNFKTIKDFNEVIKVEEHWITIELENGEIVYAYIENIVDVQK